MNMVASVFRPRTDSRERSQFFTTEQVIFSKLDENNSHHVESSLEVCDLTLKY